MLTKKDALHKNGSFLTDTLSFMHQLMFTAFYGFIYSNHKYHRVYKTISPTLPSLL